MIGIYSNLRFFPDARAVVDSAQRWEALGVDGVVMGDHLFPPFAPARSADARRGMDQLTMLTVIAAHTERLRVGALAANVGFQHPLLLIRTFAQLAELYGGERVYAGFGGGWARREFEAIGLEMPPHAERIERLGEALQLARALYDEGYADLDGKHVIARELPLSPMPSTRPQILVGGGSNALIDLAGRYADHLDFNAPSHRRSSVEPQRKLMTTVEDLEASVARLREAAVASGRPADAVTVSVVVTDISVCSDAEIDAESARICTAVGLEPRSLDDTPFALVGEPQRIADKIEAITERLGLAWIAVPYADLEQFSAEIAPLLS